MRYFTKWPMSGLCEGHEIPDPLVSEGRILTASDKGHGGLS